jgi:hypothetical protein
MIRSYIILSFLFFINSIFGQDTEYNIGFLDMVGSVNLLEVNGSDTIRNDGVIEVIVKSYSDSTISISKYAPEDTIITRFPLRGEYVLIFHSEGYQDKALIIKADKDPQKQDIYGYEFPYRVNLIKGDNIESLNTVGIIYYDYKLGYYEHRPINKNLNWIFNAVGLFLIIISVILATVFYRLGKRKNEPTFLFSLLFFTSVLMIFIGAFIIIFYGDFFS